ncbi:uracil-DNA glycosylase family protein [Methanosarcina sp. KYL-1]|uniref:uracil-DNA glycosylase family protein n=1 Tax=Methanosarcina sp. KYL-1 TaxID=2602068 RepID=UPI0021007A2A|nr:uracil-DNA glycosylase family protein [Methanosarcina sp. KYL-1]
MKGGYGKLRSLSNVLSTKCFRAEANKFITNKFISYHLDLKFETWQKNEINSIKPLVYGPENPRFLLISQAPSLQDWLNGKTSDSPDGGLVSAQNNFLVNDVLPAFGLSGKDLDLFRKNVFWAHTCNCYPWYRESTNIKSGKITRQDRLPGNKQIENCLSRWIDSLTRIGSLKAIVLMGEPATRLFPQLKEEAEGFTDLVRKMEIRNDIIEGIEILPIYHQSKKNRTFNDPVDRAVNNELKLLLKNKFAGWIE